MVEPERSWTALYIGHAAYKVGDNKEAAWHDPAEIPRQIDLNRRNFQTSGSAYFSAKSLLNPPLRLKDSLRHSLPLPGFMARTSRTRVHPPHASATGATPLENEAVRLKWKPGTAVTAYAKTPTITSSTASTVPNPATWKTRQHISHYPHRQGQRQAVHLL
ncbi:MAG: hypothetical protein R2795_05830 [Saprospiraceae bacterium]